MTDFFITVSISMAIVLVDNDLYKENITRVVEVTFGVYLLSFLWKRGKQLMNSILSHFDKS